MGSNSLSLRGKIIFGSMRMLEYNFPLEYWVKLFSDLYDEGVDTFHSSNEYESFSFFCQVLEKFKIENPSKKIKHIVKIAEPHFKINEFDSNLLKEKIEEYCIQLNVDSIEVVQWMWRGNLDDNEQRVASYENYDSQIKKTVLELKALGKINQFCCFPYSQNFAITAVNKTYIDGLVVYRNIMEQEYDNALYEAASLNKLSYVLRPLSAGKALSVENQTPKKLINFALDFPNVLGAIISISSLSKFKKLI